MPEEDDEVAGKGALNEKVDADGGLHVVSVGFSIDGNDASGDRFQKNVDPGL